MSHNAEETLMHYGMPRRSGRYPWGSGEDPYQHGKDFLSRIEELRKQNFTFTDEDGKTWTGENAIAKSMGLTSTQYRIEKSLAKDERRMYNVAKAKSMKEDGLGDSEIGRRMGVNESTVRSWLNEKSESRMKQSRETADFLKKRLDEVKADGGMIDVGIGAERELGISKEKMAQALYLLEREGYHVYRNRFDQINNPGQKTTQTVLCTPETEYKDIYNKMDKIHTVKDYITRDGGQTFEKKFTYPESMDSSRMMIRYNEEGGLQRDGIVELRRGVADLSLGNSRYSQVRILVDGTHYIKGMAVYSDDMPDGVDVIFNTNKMKGTPKEKVLKEIKHDDPENPFGSSIKDAEQGGQYWYDPKTGDRVASSHPGAKLGLINKRADEGDWSDWKDALPSQFLSKQPKEMIRKQLDLAKADKYLEYEKIKEITNPTIKKHFLEEFANNCDSAAVHLQAAALPGQKYHVIIPVNSLKDTEVYAPNYPNGTKLALVRYPHAGIFEIPVLTVNNKHAEAIRLLGSDVGDAVGITSKVAAQLSGADFDGDTVMCIPTDDSKGRVRISRRPYLEDLADFEPKTAYPERPGMKYMKDPVTGKDSTQTQMGIISNLITDMTLQGADDRELAAAVRHSMVVIDAGKHKLDYKQSEIDNNIAALKKKYQPKYDDDGNLIGSGGAFTIISKSKGEKTVDKRQGNPRYNTIYKKNGELNPDFDPTRPEGALVYKTADDLYYPDRSYNKETGIMTVRTVSGKKITYNVKDADANERYAPVKNVDPDTGNVTYTNKAGDITYRVKTRSQKSTRMAETDDAYTLVSPMRHPKELLYAEYANSMKNLANEARKELVATGKLKYSASAASVYAKEVSDLEYKLNIALMNATRERAAQRMANVKVKEAQEANPNMKSDDIKKVGDRALKSYRQEVGSVSRRDRSIDITDREWEAIQAGAISENKLTKILNNADIDKLRDRATPRAKTELSQAKVNKITAMRNSNYTINEIANALNVSVSTVQNYLKGAN